MNPVLIAVLGLIFVYLFVTLYLTLVRSLGQSSKALLKKRLGSLDGNQAADEEPAVALDILKRRQFSAMPWLNLLLERLRWSRHMDKALSQAAIKAPLSVFVLLALILSLSGYGLTSLIWENTLVALAAGALGAYLPFYWINLKKHRRAAVFESQLPEGLDLVARALKAGHTFSSGMNMVAQEFSDPIRSEFAKTNEEINLGKSATEALDSLAERIDCPDLNFFVISVKIQNETGGNLAEIVENIATLIRERFKLKGRVKVLSAEGRFAALVLLLLPPGISVVINIINPEYMQPFFQPGPGKTMLYVAGALMLLGIVVIKKMINIKV